MNHVNTTAFASTSNDTKPKKPGDVKMNRLTIHPRKNNRARLHSDNVASTSTVKAAASTKFKIQMDVKMKGPLHMEEKVKDYRFSIHSKRVMDDVKNVASTSMATSVETKNAPYKFKKAKTDLRNQVNGSAGKYTALIKPTTTRFNEGKKPVDKIRQQHMPKLKDLCLELHRKWHTCFTLRIAHLNINQSSENHNHEAALVDLTKCFSNWNIVKKNRSPLGSRPIEMDEDARTAAETLMLMANDHFSKAKQPKTIMWT
ncbi:hypothetical protein Tco_0705397 [Tanacetum coccineum]|uniref:Uncharacterized protein n=1 Tax=Tanacetum coccineum TaxID=301880 RepID=A0ABQ4Y5V2_9ASTR